MKTLLLTSTLFVFLISCSSSEGEQPTTVSTSTEVKSQVTGTLPKANGIPGRVLISVEDNVWDGELAEIFKTHFSKEAKGPFIGAEPVMDYLQQDPSQINMLGKKNRNFLRIILDKESVYSETEVIVKKNHISRGQLYMVVKDSDKGRLLSFFKNELPTYIELFNDQENERLIQKYSNNRNFGFDKRAKEQFGISIGIPVEAKFKADLDTVIYALDKKSKELGDNPKTGAKGGVYWAQKGIIIWESDYVDESSMSPVNLLKERDSTLKYVVKGTVVNSYMATEYYPTRKPVFTQLEVDGANAMQIEGLWIHGGNPSASGGGPFIQYSIQHPTRNTIVHATTYVYALNFAKRELFREVHAMLKTITIAE